MKNLICRKNAYNFALIPRIASRLMLLGLSLVVILGLFTSNAHAQATDIYITPDGGGSGICTNNTHPPSWFNNSANWGSSGTQIGPGTTVHLCGTFTGATNTTMFTAHGSGTSGNPITILFESGTVLKNPSWPISGAINIGGQSHLVVDGGVPCGYIDGVNINCNGSIENTNAGSGLSGNGLSNGQVSAGIQAGSSSYPGCTPGCRVTNLAIANLYVRTVSTDYSPNQGGISAIEMAGADGMRVDHNVFHDCGWCIAGASSSTGAGNNFEIDHNNIYNMDHGIAYGANTSVSNGPRIHDNHFHDYSNWDSPANAYHHDGIHLWNSGTFVTSNVQIYNNLFDGNSGNNITSHLYTENYTSNIQIFNNVFIVQGPWGMSGMVWMGNQSIQSPLIANNSFLNINGAAASGIKLEHNSNATFENNYCQCAVFVNYVQGTTVSVADYNLYEAQNPGGNYAWNLGTSTQTNNITTWKNSTGLDVHSQYFTAISTNMDGTLKVGSPAVGAGKNLTSLGIVALNSDKNGSPRSSTGVWSAGAFDQSSTATAPPTAPTGLKAVVN